MNRPNGGGFGERLDFPDLSKMPNLPKKSLGKALYIIPILLAVLLLLNSFFTVKPEEMGIVLRLGKYRGAASEAGPGLHFKIPFIDKVSWVPVERQLKEEFGFRTESIGVKSTFADVDEEASMLTGDLNAAMVEFVVQYRVVDAYKFLFRVRRVQDTFRDMSEAVMRKIVGDRTVNEVLTVGRAEIENEVMLELQELCDQYESGIRVDQVVLQSINPPDPVKPSFNEVNQSEQELERLINEAQQQYNRLVPQAEGQALQTIQQAEGYATDRVNRSRGDVARFNVLYREYAKAPEVTRKRIYLETMNRVLNQAGQKMVVDDDLDGLIPMLGVEGSSSPSTTAAAGAAAAQRQQSNGGGSN